MDHDPINILNIAFYQFIDLSYLKELESLKKELLQECLLLNLKGKILLSQEGINGVLAGSVSEIRTIQSKLSQFTCFSKLQYKESYSHFRPFKRMLVKVKKEIIALGDEAVKPAVFSAKKITPVELKKWLDEGREFSLLDTRNAYEIEYGTFKEAIHMHLKNFRQFSSKLKNLSLEQEQKPLVVFCTGGIRCEKASVVALQSGIREVFQLDGGILNYFEQVGGAHYKGDCFVFDERVAVCSDLTPQVDFCSSEKRWK